MPARRTLLLNGATTGISSFALANQRLIVGLTRAGYDVWRSDDAGFASDVDLPDVCLAHGHPYDPVTAPGRVNLFFLEYEYARLSPALERLRDAINARFDVCIVPSHFVRRACESSGIERPIAVCPLGVDLSEFHPGVIPAMVPTDKSFKFVYVGGATERKGVDILVRAFRAAFTAEDDVALVLKTYGYDHLLPWFQGVLAGGDEGPEIIHRHGPEDSIAGYFAGADMGVFPFRGEGFGLPVLECIASGVPVIVTEGGGPADFCSPDNATFVRASTVMSDGKMALEPDLEELQARMRAAFENRRADRNPRRVRESVAAFTWEQTTARLADILETTVATARSRSVPAGRVVTHAYGEIGPTSWKKVTRHVDDVLRARFDTASFDGCGPVANDGARVVVGQSGFALEHFARARRAAGDARTLLIRASGPWESVVEIRNAERAACGLEQVRPPALEAWRQRQEVRLADVILVHSHASARRYIERGRSADTVAIVPLGFTVSRPIRYPRSGTLRFLFIGTDPFRKGLRVLLEAWDDLRPSHAELLCLVDTEVLRSKPLLRLLVRNANVHVRPLVPHGELEAVYDQVDCQILPSFEDGFSVAVADGMGRGIPAIVSREVGIAELINDGRDGIIVETGSVTALRNAIAGVCADRIQLERMGGEAFETARRRPWEHFELGVAEVVDTWLKERAR